jgi:undecaprenyl-diphosphatase
VSSRGLVDLWAALRPLLELRPLLAILLLGAAAWVFIEIADEVLEGEAIPFDETLLLALRTVADPAVPRGPVWLQEAVRDITALGGYTILTVVTVATAAYLWMARQGRVALFVLAAATGALFWVVLFKLGFDRPRPELVPHIMAAPTPSFPSGHSASAAAVYLTLGALLARFQTRRRLRLFFVGLAVAITVLVGFSRVYLGVHWPSDVVAGWTLGGGWAVACWLAASWLRRRHVLPETADQAEPGPGGVRSEEEERRGG